MIEKRGQWLSLSSTWRASGADAFAVSGFSWKLSGITYSSSSNLSTTLGAGTYPFQLSYNMSLRLTARNFRAAVHRS
ncbi:hypothetical protein [Stigmatella erecta]|uniref:Uncharacterized protein n=1 Tax=Stigmatella erecta TaxID=83460 RepID=A0A1I0JUM6_9BACT|nr:hypothetical protein [Stigmatella erecta]SEU14179.1 hypothetical protein SAMN05443639_108110 [Stigmatella erecta]